MTGFVYHDYLCQPLTEKLILFNLRQTQAMNGNHRHKIKNIIIQLREIQKKTIDQDQTN